MEESMKFNSQICTTKEQSERLLKLGLKPETADMCWFNDMQKPFCSPYKCFVEKAQEMKWIIFPAWSLHRLIELIDVYEVLLEWKFGIYECVISMLEERIKDGLINNEYLKQ